MNGRDYTLVYALATLANLLILIPQYFATLQLSSIAIRIPTAAVAYWAAHGYPLPAAVFLAMIPSVAIFQLILAVLLYWTSRYGDLRRGWRWKYRVVSMLAVVYVGYALGVDFLVSLNVASGISGFNVDISSLLQTFYVFNLGAAVLYLGLVLVLRRTYTRLSAEEAAGTVSVKTGILEKQ